MSGATVGERYPTVPVRGRALPAFLLVGWRWISRHPAVAITPVLLPFIFLYFLSLISPPSLRPLEIVGAMLFTMQNIGSWVLGDSATWRIECSLQDLFVASPLGRLRYLFGIAFSNLIAMLPALVVLTVLLAWVGGSDGHPLTWYAGGVVLASLAVMWVLFSSIGIAISSRVRTQREIWPVGNLTFTLLGMLSPLYYPVSYLPPVWRDAAHFLPTTYAALLAQGALGLTPATPAQMALYAGLLAVCAMVGLAITLRLYRWGEQ
ncbi:MAG TPA: ABC transporter permease [Thermoplasmata archaeon]|nr:ABC transporter permease [Thermoplasmata archaeon]